MRKSVDTLFGMVYIMSMEEREMTALARDIMTEDLVYEARINVKRYARAIQNLSRIGNIKGANHYREKLAEQRRIIRTSLGAY